MGLPKNLVTGCAAKLPGSFHGFPQVATAGQKRARKPAQRSPRPDLPEETVVGSIAVRLPPIDHHLLPNRARRLHWAEKRRKAKRLRKLAADEAWLARRRAGMSGCWHQARLEIYAWYPTRQTPDPDNLIAALKPAIDGLADAGVFRNDRDLEIMPPVIVKGKSPSILLVVKRAE